MEKQTKKTRLEYIFEIFKNDYKKAVKNKIIYKTTDFESFANSRQTDDEEGYAFCIDSEFIDFYRNNYQSNGIKIEGESPMHMLYNFFIDCDPSGNKEYVSWFVNLYRYYLNSKEAYQHQPAVFFEDLQSKVKEALEVFSFLKKTNVLSVENRDINNYKNMYDFVQMVKPYMIVDSGDDSVHTLDHKEMACIQNFVEKNKSEGQAELVFENSEWVIVITHDRKANIEFGKYTTWCTAGTRYGNMFDSYHGRGELFVLIKKGYGSKKQIDKHPEYRLQFHFEDNMYMNALDRSIDINDFLFKYKDIKKYFRNYIIKRVLPYRQNKNHRQVDDIKYLLNLGFGDEIIKIFKESKPETVDFSGHKIEAEYLENLGEITSIKKLDLSDCDLTYLPESIKNLKNLKSLKFRNNKSIKQVPDWVSELTSLEYFDCAGCDIKEIGNLGNCNQISELVLDANPKLKELPKNIGNLKKLTRLTASGCDLREITDDLLNCSDIFLLDVHMNTKLEKIPVGLSKLPNIVAICIDDTKISQQTKKLMESDSNGTVCIIKYGA
jgi:hypothetical protein